MTARLALVLLVAACGGGSSSSGPTGSAGQATIIAIDPPSGSTISMGRNPPYFPTKVNIDLSVTLSDDAGGAEMYLGVPTAGGNCYVVFSTPPGNFPALYSDSPLHLRAGQQTVHFSNGGQALDWTCGTLPVTTTSLQPALNTCPASGGGICTPSRVFDPIAVTYTFVP